MCVLITEQNNNNGADTPVSEEAPSPSELAQRDSERDDDFVI